MKRSKKKKSDKLTPKQKWQAGWDLLKGHSLLSGLAYNTYPEWTGLEYGVWTRFRNNKILVNADANFEFEEWNFLMAKPLVHLAFNHHKGPDDLLWDLASEIVAHRFILQLGVGKPPSSMMTDVSRFPKWLDAEKVRTWLENNPNEVQFAKSISNAGSKRVFTTERVLSYLKPKTEPNWQDIFASSLVKSVNATLEDVAPKKDEKITEATRARDWFLSSYPLLGAMAASFELIEDLDECRAYDVDGAAVSASQRKIFINPLASFSEEELKFVLAHEYLHVALHHEKRQEWRDHFLWNVACDYVINEWLNEMALGEMPDGCLYDPKLKGMSAEEIYDIIRQDMRKYRKLATLRGVGAPDVIPSTEKGFWDSAKGVQLDDFYRSALERGLEYHYSTEGRGLLPAGLEEEIRKYLLPPIPWKVELARWFDENFPDLEPQRTYSRASRRQSSTPDIPRPAYYFPEDEQQSLVFGVILDTSGSMGAKLLGQGLGAIISYSLSKDVPMVRLIYCDAHPHDQGWIEIEDLLQAEKVKVKGRGGTVLQPAIDLLDNAKDFPKKAPVLVITDGWIDVLTFRGRAHGYLCPKGSSLPYKPKGPVFWIK